MIRPIRGVPLHGKNTDMNKQLFRLLPILVLSLAGLQVHALPGETALPGKTCDTLLLAGFNDFHGSFQEEKDIPGAARLAGSILHLQHTRPNVIVLAGGDNYSGGYFPRLTGGKPLKELFDCMGVAFSAIGNHEFDWGIEAMRERLEWGDTRYLAANIFSDSLLRARPSWARPYAILRKELRNGTAARIAFIGLTTQETKTAAMPAIVKDLYFADPAKTAMEVRKALEDSADLFILLTHIGTRMEGDSVVFDEPCARGLSSIPGIDGIFTGHSHKEVCGTHNGIPVLQARNYGRKIACMRFELCQEGNGRISKRFLDANLSTPGKEKAPSIDSLVKRYLDDPEYAFNEILCQNSVPGLDPEAPVPGTGFTPIGALVTQAYQDCYRRLAGNETGAETGTPRKVIGVCNLGAIRAAMPQGPVTRLQAGNILPFGGELKAFRLSGKQLLQLLQDGLDCPAGWLQYHDLKIEVRNGKIERAFYADPSGVREIKDEDSYTVVTENFLSSGGDGYDKKLFLEPDPAFSSVPASLRNPTDVFIGYLQQLGRIRPEDLRTPAFKAL